ncbi:MAG: hypothetical protein QGI09_11515, partial [Dehalococcoidia bacterium]|nr:hypothetical protein [Dehalococcoidia bacterium]
MLAKAPNAAEKAAEDKAADELRLKFTATNGDVATALELWQALCGMSNQRQRSITQARERVYYARCLLGMVEHWSGAGLIRLLHLSLPGTQTFKQSRMGPTYGLQARIQYTAEEKCLLYCRLLGLPLLEASFPKQCICAYGSLMHDGYHLARCAEGPGMSRQHDMVKYAIANLADVPEFCLWYDPSVETRPWTGSNKRLDVVLRNPRSDRAMAGERNILVDVSVTGSHSLA